MPFGTVLKEDFIALDAWKSVMERKHVPVSWAELQGLFEWARGRGFFSDPADAFSGEVWGSLGECLMDFLSSPLMLEAARLLVVWRKIDLFFREMDPASSEISADSRSDPPSPVVGGGPQRDAAAVSDVGFPSGLDPLSPRSEDSFPPPPADALEDLFLSDSDFEFLGNKGSLNPPRPFEQREGGAPQSSRPAPPTHAPRRRRVGMGEPSIQAFPALTGGEEPAARVPPLVEHDSITMLCPNCGTSTRYPLDTSRVEPAPAPPHLGAEGGSLGASAPAPPLQSVQGAGAAGGEDGGPVMR
ncbi:uncharacterized protein LOC134565115 isoform X2 [Prinia subflava]|uniref:uncharacterized protein LOC134565115 isoform X2 n=1 Tax=Prinia subflava TaxID=208062 RepID=UPI002FE092E0